MRTPCLLAEMAVTRCPFSEEMASGPFRSKRISFGIFAVVTVEDMKRSHIFVAEPPAQLCCESSMSVEMLMFKDGLWYFKTS